VASRASLLLTLLPGRIRAGIAQPGWQALPFLRNPVMTVVAGARYIRQKRAIDGEFVFAA
jgi:hypothetical protein